LTGGQKKEIACKEEKERKSVREKKILAGREKESTRLIDKTIPSGRKKRLGVRGSARAKSGEAIGKHRVILWEKKEKRCQILGGSYVLDI